MMKWLSELINYLKKEEDGSGIFEVLNPMPKEWLREQDRIEYERRLSNPSTVRDFDEEYRKQGRDPKTGEYK